MFLEDSVSCTNTITIDCLSKKKVGFTESLQQEGEHNAEAQTCRKLNLLQQVGLKNVHRTL